MENNIIEQEITQQETVQETNIVTNSETESNERDENTEPVGYFAFLGLFILFAIPVVGWIACAIMMFAPKKKSIKNYARAVMTRWVLKLAVFALVVFMAVSVFGNYALPSINAALGTEFTDIGELAGLITAGTSGNYSEIIKSMKPQLIDTFGAEYEPVIDEFSKEEYNVLIDQILNGEYEQALTDLKAGRYVQLENVLGADEYDALLSELELAVNGESQVFDEFRRMVPYSNGSLDVGKISDMLSSYGGQSSGMIVTMPEDMESEFAAQPVEIY